MPANPPRAVQLVTLNMEDKRVDVNEEALTELTQNLEATGAKKMAIVSVMGAFRGGKSFLLDLFLRKLRYDRKTGNTGESTNSREVPPRGGDEPYKLPAWLLDAGKNIEGGTADSSDGFRFKGGMDHCTEGIWAWSEPFVRKINGEDVALLLLDTQGAWDGNMTKEQSATIFGMTALISSKQIYNVSQQIQEDKVENLAYFMRFAQAALRQTAKATKGGDQANIDTPFQSLDFLVRDWANFEDEWTLEKCKEQMAQHRDRHLNPEKVVENSTAEALQCMFERIECWCLPHPGLKINKATWTGNVDDIDPDFVRFLDEYVHQVFSEGLKVKRILGSEMTSQTFPKVFQTFVRAFQDAAPVAMSFNQAMTKATVLLAKEQAIESYVEKMNETLKSNPSGLSEDDFEANHSKFSSTVEEEYKKVTILGSDEVRDETWEAIRTSLESLHQRFRDENARRLEKALVVFANYALVAIVLFVLDRISDWVCDWWSQTCQDMSRVMLSIYLILATYVGYQAYKLNTERGRLATAAAAAELWKEVLRLGTVYWGLLFTKETWAEVGTYVMKGIEYAKDLASGKQKPGNNAPKETKKNK